MKILITALVLLACGSHAHAQSTTQRDAPTTRFYTPNGSSAGSATTYGNTTRFYDSRGNSVGTATTNGGRR